MVSVSKASLAVKSGDVRKIEEMLREGLDANGITKKGWSILHVAAKAGKPQIVAFLLDRSTWAMGNKSNRETVKSYLPDSQIILEEARNRSYMVSSSQSTTR